MKRTVSEYWRYLFSTIPLLAALAGLSALYLLDNWATKTNLPLPASTTQSESLNSQYAMVFESWRDVCQKQNAVLDPETQSPETFASTTPPWSLTINSFAQNPKQMRCSSLSNLLEAVKYGQRIWPNESSSFAEERSFDVSVDYEKRPSYFDPKGCNIDYIDHREACDILNRFSHIILAGDSLGRQMMQGFMMLLTQDMVLGSFPRAIDKPSQILEHCRCDGQFSAHKLCRTFDQSFLHDDPRHYGICSHLKESEIFRLQYRMVIPGEGDDGKIWRALCDEVHDRRRKSVLVILNGGAWYESKAQKTIDGLINTIHRQLEAVKATCPSKVSEIKVLWTGLNAQSRRVDGAYPHQSREQASLFNDMVDQHVATEYGMMPLNFWNVTRDAMTSDGHHYLSDVNMYKANVLLHVAKFVAEATQ